MVIWKQEVYSTGRCVNCGFLGKRDEDLRISECYSVSGYEREFGILNEYIDPRPRGTLEIVPKIKTFPWCFVGKANLGNEVEELFDAEDAKPGNLNVYTQRIIAVERDCSSWYPWREFASPKEHFEESMMLAMEKRREEFDIKLFELSQKIQTDSKEIVEKSDRFNRRITIFIIILAVLEVAGTLLALFFHDGF